MFEALSDRLTDIFQGLRSKGTLTERDVDQAMREIRMSLLEADVNFKVVKEFVAHVKERSVGSEVLQSLTPAQQVVKIVHEELLAILGEPARLELSGTPPSVILLAGLQGSGKTTTAAKLANYLRKQGQYPVLAALDIYRPAAIDQLISLGKQLNVPVHSEGSKVDPVKIAGNAVSEARRNGNTVVILDTAGRLHVDDDMMRELQEIEARVKPSETLLVADAMTGQDAVHTAEEFNRSVKLTGLILTKMDGDARGGAALSIRHVTGIPIKFVATGEKTDALDLFHPDRLAQRILGMGDVLSLIERTEEAFSKDQQELIEKKMRRAEFDFDDFLQTMSTIRKMGPLSNIMEMIPGMRGAMKQMGGMPNVDDKNFKRIEAIITSMTKHERRSPGLIDGSRRKRIARGSGTSVQEVNELLNRFKDMQKLMKQLTKGKMRLPKGMGLPGL
ncbi:MAG TPA: signal recognition particle protein [Chloroflexi bacterium]|jgi:signal recognition particle subunit SRP54|nr:signal recognition particle protein [Chloroflexota bacterium]